MSNSLSKLISVGRAIKAHGIKGELKFFLYNSESDILINKKNIWFEIENEFVSFSLISSKGINGEIVKLNKVNNRDEANLLKGKEFFVLRKDFPNLEDGNFYLNDIINFVVYYKEEKIGFISDILSLPAGDIMEINTKGKDILIPMLDQYLKFFDFDKKIVELKNVKELLNL